MIRVFLDEGLVFLLPFAVFALYLAARRRNPFVWASWSKESVWLLIGGLACVIAAFLATGLLAERQTGAFEPTHVENGRVVPGHFR